MMFLNPTFWYILIAACAASYVAGCTEEKMRGAEFVGAVKALGEQQEERAAAYGRLTKLAKEKHDAKFTNDLSMFSAELNRMRDESASRSLLSSVSGGTKLPQQLCYDSAKLDRAVESLRAGVRSIIERGGTAEIRLLCAQEWLKEVGSAH